MINLFQVYSNALNKHVTEQYLHGLVATVEYLKIKKKDIRGNYDFKIKKSKIYRGETI